MSILLLDRPVWARRTAFCCLFACFAVIAVLAATAAKSATYLPNAADLPKTLMNIDGNVATDLTINSYLTPPGLKNFKSDVKCPVAGCNFPAGTKIGIFDFDYAGYRGTFKSGTDTFDFAGAIIRGGFILDPKFVIKPDWKLRWLQTRVETGPDAGNPAEIVDGTPFYPDFPINGVTTALFDAPGRVFGLTTRKVTYESFLVCVDCSDQTNVKYIAGLTWGFDLTKAAGANPGTLALLDLTFLNVPTQKYRDLVKAAGLDLEAGCCLSVVPLPAPAFLLLSALASVAAVSGAMRRKPCTAVGA